MPVVSRRRKRRHLHHLQWHRLGGAKESSRSAAKGNNGRPTDTMREAIKNHGKKHSLPGIGQDATATVVKKANQRRINSVQNVEVETFQSTPAPSQN